MTPSRPDVRAHLTQLLETCRPLAVLAGSGLSIAEPSHQMSGAEFSRRLLSSIAPTAEVEHRLLELTSSERRERRNRGDFIRFEAVMKVVRDSVDHDLELLSYIADCDRPNRNHHALARLLAAGHPILTTNFDVLIEHALLEQGTAFTAAFDDQHFLRHLERPAADTLFKLHGTVSHRDGNIWRDTRSSVQATLDTVGTPHGDDLVTSPRGRVLTQLLQQQHLLVVGYSGFDDFDICPILKQVSTSKSIIWINHNPAVHRYWSWSDLKDAAPRDDNGAFLNRREELLYSLAGQQPAPVRRTESIHLFDIDTEIALQALDDRWPDADAAEAHDPSSEHEQFFRSWSLKHVPSLAHRHFLCATLFHSLGYLDDAFDQYSAARDEFHRAEHVHGTAQSLHNMGVILQRWGRLSDALAHYEESLRLKRTSGNRGGSAQSLHSIGIIHQRRNDFEQARRCYEESLAIRRELQDRPGIAMTLHQLGRLDELSGALVSAAENYQASKAIEIELGNKEGLATSLRSIAGIHRQQGQLDVALAECLAALAISEELGDIAGIAPALYELGRIHQLLGAHPEAMRHYLASLQQDQMLGDTESVAVTQYQLGLLYLEIDQPAAARDWLMRARDAFRTNGSARLSMVEDELERLRSERE